MDKLIKSSEQLSKRESFMLLALYVINSQERYALGIASKLGLSQEYVRATLGGLKTRKLIKSVPRRRQNRVYYFQPLKGNIYHAIRRHFKLRTISVAANSSDEFIEKFKKENEL